MLKDLVKRGRTYRRFYQDRGIDMKTLEELVDLARLAPSGMNKQYLRYMLSNAPQLNEAINGTLVWGAYFKGWISPPEGEKPAAFIVVLREKSLVTGMKLDEGFACQNIVLGAAEKGLGCCCLGNIDRQKLSGILSLDGKYEIALVVGIGYPKEEIAVDEVDPNGDIKYWRDEQQVHHIPKRKLKDIIIR
ncbi:MAG: nitroreductase family protein [Christensenellales bacterium]